MIPYREAESSILMGRVVDGYREMDRAEQKEKRRTARKRNLAHKNSPYNTKGHSHRSGRDYRRPQKVGQGLILDQLDDP
jgi:hypothetical protein